MDKKNWVNGRIIALTKLWWIKINKKPIRTSPSDGATFPYRIKVEYFVNSERFEGNKFVYFGNDSVNIGDEVIVTYLENNPSKILKISKQIK